MVHSPSLLLGIIAFISRHFYTFEASSSIVRLVVELIRAFVKTLMLDKIYFMAITSHYEGSRACIPVLGLGV